jgi:DNA polymerase sigma
MVINFLQTRSPPILPSLQKLPHKQRLSNGIDVGFCDDPELWRDFGTKNTETLGGLLYAFFVRYAVTCYANVDSHLNLIMIMMSSQ